MCACHWAGGCTASNKAGPCLCRSLPAGHLCAAGRRAAGTAGVAARSGRGVWCAVRRRTRGLVRFFAFHGWEEGQLPRWLDENTAAPTKELSCQEHAAHPCSLPSPCCPCTRYLETASGHHWMAQRLPNDTFFISANQGRFQEVGGGAGCTGCGADPMQCLAVCGCPCLHRPPFCAIAPSPAASSTLNSPVSSTAILIHKLPHLSASPLNAHPSPLPTHASPCRWRRARMGCSCPRACAALRRRAGCGTPPQASPSTSSRCVWVGSALQPDLEGLISGN